MSDTKKRPSGAEFRKRAKLRVESDKKNSGALKNWLTSQNENNDEPTIPTSEEDQHFEPQSSSFQNNSEIYFPKGFEDREKLVEIAEVTEPINPSVDIDDFLTHSESSTSSVFPNEKFETINNFYFDPDPANWVVNNELRDYVAKYGLLQNKNVDFTKSRRQYGNRFWSLNANHFSRHLINGEIQDREWLVYSEKKASVFCGSCTLFHSHTHAESSFIKEGFNDWKNVSVRLKDHENSLYHRNNILTLKERGEKLGKINVKLTEMVDQEISYWKMVLQRVVVAIKALASRGLSFRGSDETFGSNNNGNYMMMLETISQFDPFLTEHIKKFGNPGRGKTSYLSSTTCDEFIELLAKQILNEIINETKVSKYYSVIVDSTPDVSHVDQLSIVLRYVKPNGEPIERFVKFLPKSDIRPLICLKL